MNRRHPDWCAAGHRCGLGEHRAAPITITVPRAGAATLTRVRATDGTEHAEIRLTLALTDYEPAARAQLAAALTHLRTLIGPPRATRRAA